MVKDRVAIGDVVNRYLPGQQSKGRYICCPFHPEKTASLRLYDHDYHCFGCGAHGDAVDFVARLQGIAPAAAIERINADFALGLPVGRKPTLRELAANGSTRRGSISVEKARVEKERTDDAYYAALAEYLRLYRNKRDFAPQTEQEEWHPLFVEALQKLSYQTFLLDEAEGARCRR